MDLSNCISIELKEFGYEGVITMALPSLRRNAWLKNQAAKYTKTTTNRSGHREITEADVGTLEVLSVLAYVKAAPFTPEIEPFYSFCDELEELKPGASTQLFEKMSEAVKTINEGKVSPLA